MNVIAHNGDDKTKKHMNKKQLTLTGLPFLSRDEFLAPFDTVFDKLMVSAFPEFGNQFGIHFFENQSYPKVDVIDFTDKVEIHAELPGISKENVKVDVQDNTLTISGGTKTESTEQSGDSRKYIRKELKRSNFKRSFSLGETLDQNSVDALYKDGILTIKINKVKPVEVKPRVIDIK